MAADYKTFPVELTPPKTPLWEHLKGGSPGNLAEQVARDVDAEINKRRKERWHMRGAPWVLDGTVFLTMWRED